MSEESFDPYHRWLGIPPKDQPPDHYRLLGIERFESSPDVISDAADRQMAHLRSHQLGRQGAFSQRLLNEVAAARVYLLDPQKKADYDAQLRRNAAVRAQAAPAPAAIPVPPNPTITPASRTPIVQIQPDANLSYRAARRNKSSALPVLVVGAAGVLLAGGLIWYLNGFQEPWSDMFPVGADQSGGAHASVGQDGTGGRPEPGRPNAVPPRDRELPSGDSPEGRHRGDRPAPEAVERRPPPASDSPPRREPRSLADLMNQPTPSAGGSTGQTQPEPTDPLRAEYYVWQWQLERGSAVRLKFYPDGTASNFQENTGNPDFTWALSDNTLVLRWPQGRVDTMTVSPDGRSCFGVNQAGRRVLGQLFSVGPPRP